MKTMKTSKNILDNIGQNKLKMFQTRKVKVGNKNTNNDILEPQAATEGILQELLKKTLQKLFLKISQYLQETPVLGSLFNKVAGLQESRKQNRSKQKHALNKCYFFGIRI